MIRNRVLILFLCVMLVVIAAISVSPAQADGELWNYPVIPSIRGALANHLIQIVKQGKALGNRLDVFSKIGDSITVNEAFLTPIGTGGLRLGGYTYLQSTVNFFSRNVARTHNSFANVSLAAHGGWDTHHVLSPGDSMSPVLCHGDETPLDCELRITKPSVALIMFGTNDTVDLTGAQFEANLNRIVDICEQHGVIPVLSTTLSRLAPQLAVDNLIPYNMITVRVAQQRLVPLWNYWLAVYNLPNHGVSTDNVHPSVPSDLNTAIFDRDHLVYGIVMRNLTALQVLDALRSVLH